MQVRTETGLRRYSSVRQAVREIWRTEGWIGLYRGVGPTTQRAALLTASQLASYDHAKRKLLDSGYFREGFPLHATASMIAGFVCALTTSPVDLVKSRYMNQSFDGVSGLGIRYANAFDCARSTVLAEGPLALYKGFAMNWLRIGPHTICTFLVFEQLRRISGIPPM